MKIAKFSLSAIVILLSGIVSSYRPTKGQDIVTWFKFSGSQNKTGYNTPSNYTKETLSICTNGALLCEIAVTAITHTSLHIVTIPVIPAGLGTVISSLNGDGTKNASGGSYTVASKTVEINFIL